MKLQNIFILSLATILFSSFTFAAANSASIDSAMASDSHSMSVANMKPAAKKKLASKQNAAKKSHHLAAAKTSKPQQTKTLAAAKKLASVKMATAIAKATNSARHFASTMKSHERASTTVSRLESKMALARANSLTQIAVRQQPSPMKPSTQVTTRQESANVMAANY